MSKKIPHETPSYDGGGIVPPYLLEQLRQRHEQAKQDLGIAAETLTEIEQPQGEIHE